MTFKQLDKFYTTLFGPDDNVCWSITPYGTMSLPVWKYGNIQDCNFFSINPLSGSRCDANVTAYRNILIEFDTISLTEQLKLIATIPHTTVVYSGGKSYHAIISLVEPCSTRDEYDTLVRRIYDRLPDADKTAKNPSRFSRAPGAIRENGITQDLVEVRNQVSREELEAWLGPDIVEEAYPIDTFNPARAMQKLNPNTAYFLHFGAPEGEWNKQLFLSAMDLARCGRSAQEIMSTLQEVTGKLDNSDKRTIGSAIKIVAKE